MQKSFTAILMGVYFPSVEYTFIDPSESTRVVFVYG